MAKKVRSTADKLDSALGFIGPLSNDVEAERKQGLFVAILAVRFALQTLAHFGLLDDPRLGFHHAALSTATVS